MRRIVLLALVLASPGWPQADFFEARIRPVLIANCESCHDSSKATSGLKIDSREGLQRGGSRGTAVSPGNPDGSLLYRAISYRDPMLKMPPSGKLPDAVIADFRQWIEQGAHDPRSETPGAPQPGAINWERARLHWSFQPIKRAGPPKTRNTTWPRSPIDSFLLAKLEDANLSPAAPADRRTLLRRASFDLTGLPPTPEELEAFLKDSSPAAFEKVVNRLLASSHYGERWGRHWLDLVRFAETNGHEFDFYKDEAWRYRDYVIRAFNEDFPYDRFVFEHIAGDGMAGRRLSTDGKYWETPLASGFFGLGEERNGATDLEEVRSEMRDSKIDVFGKAFLGLTVACARCHDHKFDPIPTTDYYGLGGIFDSTRTTLASVSSPEVEKEIDEIVARLKADAPASGEPQTIQLRDGDELFDMRRFSRSGAAFAERSARLDSSRGVSDKLTGIMVSRSFIPTKRYIHVRVAGTKFNPVREEPSQLAVTIFAPGRYPKGVAGDGDRKMRWKTIPLKEEVNQVCHLEIADRRRNGHIVVDAIVLSDSKEPPEDRVETLAPLPAGGELEASIPTEIFGRISYEDVPHNLRIHERGNHLNLGQEVPRRFLQILDGENTAPYSNGSGRMALAEALTRPDNPLLARVMVNRIWKHHFGEGLVRSVDNFGKTGDRPSHPELLDYLAQEFIRSGWSMKAMHRMMMLSAAYGMDSSESAAAKEKDPQNRLLSHMPVRRLDAESVRDAILAVSGSLDRTVYGPSIPVHVSAYQDGRGKPASGPLDGAGRRSIYLEVRRNFLAPLLLAFDYPLPTSTAGRRMVSNVPAQALTLMNNEFVVGQAALWSGRMETSFTDPRARLDAMFVRIFGRTPEPAERDSVQTFLAEGSWSDLAHVLFNAKEFLFLR
jgi:hypothetical protein